MKNKTLITILFSALLIFNYSNAQSGIFFSEYAEGTSNNKYLEIYNPTTEAVSLDGYALASVSNAPSTPGTHEYWRDFVAGASIAPGGVYIIAHPSIDSTLIALADETHSYLSNGDDGYALVEGTEASYTIVDTIGDFQGDPGAGWDVAGVTEATKDKTLVRKDTITAGNSDWNASRGTTTEDSEWIVYDQNTWTYLGAHPGIYDPSSDTGGGDTGGGDTGGDGDSTGPTVSGLIISQYVETDSGSEPKGIELWNNSGGTIDFTVTPLAVLKGSNGGSLSNDFTLSTGTLADGAVMVIGTAVMGDYLTAISSTAQYHVENFTFNGDDALQIQLNGVVQDTFGTPGSDPGSAWSNGDSSDLVQTANLTLVLKTGVTTGDIDGWSDPSLRFETLKDSSGETVVNASPSGAYGLTGFGVAPTLPDPAVDTDGDTYNDDVDAFPNDSTEWADADSDGVGDNADVFDDDPTESADADGDGVGDNADVFDDDPTESADTDGDGVGDNSDLYAGYNDAIIGTFLTDYPQSGDGGGGLTQEDLLDARVGSVAVSVTDGTATITLQVEQSDDNMATWSTPAAGATTVDLPVTGDATFFRVRAQ